VQLRSVSLLWVSGYPLPQRASAQPLGPFALGWCRRPSTGDAKSFYVTNWLRTLGLERFEATFRENEIDETVLSDLTEDHLRVEPPWIGLPHVTASLAPSSMRSGVS
jgi:hypothetical protein